MRLCACLHEARKSFIPLQSSCKTMPQEFSAPICARDSEAQRYVGREGAYETHVRAHRAQSSSTPLCQRLNVVMTRLRGLIQIARNPYRPELHYMRGPGQSGTRSIRKRPALRARLRNQAVGRGNKTCETCISLALRFYASRWALLAVISWLVVTNRSIHLCPKKEMEATPADATAADAKEVRVGEMPTASALAGAT